MCKYYIACYDKIGNFQHYEVPEEISVYIHQLEAYIRYPHISKLKERYKKFANVPFLHLTEEKSKDCFNFDK